MASDRVRGKRLKEMIPTLLPAPSSMADCSLASLIAPVFWPSTQQPSTACLSTSKSQRAAGGDAWASIRQSRDGSLIVEGVKHAQGLFPWLLEDSDVFPAT